MQAGYLWINGASTHYVGVPFGARELWHSLARPQRVELRLWHVPAGDVPALGQAILRLLDDAPLRARMATAAIARARGTEPVPEDEEQFEASEAGRLG